MRAREVDELNKDLRRDEISRALGREKSAGSGREEKEEDESWFQQVFNPAVKTAEMAQKGIQQALPASVKTGLERASNYLPDLKIDSNSTGSKDSKASSSKENQMIAAGSILAGAVVGDVMGAGAGFATQAAALGLASPKLRSAVENTVSSYIGKENSTAIQKASNEVFQQVGKEVTKAAYDAGSYLNSALGAAGNAINSGVENLARSLKEVNSQTGAASLSAEKTAQTAAIATQVAQSVRMEPQQTIEKAKAADSSSSLANLIGESTQKISKNASDSIQSLDTTNKLDSIQKASTEVQPQSAEKNNPAKNEINSNGSEPALTDSLKKTDTAVSVKESAPVNQILQQQPKAEAPKAEAVKAPETRPLQSAAEAKPPVLQAPSALPAATAVKASELAQASPSTRPESGSKVESSPLNPELSTKAQNTAAAGLALPGSQNGLLEHKNPGAKLDSSLPLAGLKEQSSLVPASRGLEAQIKITGQRPDETAAIAAKNLQLNTEAKTASLNLQIQKQEQVQANGRVLAQNTQRQEGANIGSARAELVRGIEPASRTESGPRIENAIRPDSNNGRIDSAVRPDSAIGRIDAAIKLDPNSRPDGSLKLEPGQKQDQAIRLDLSGKISDRNASNLPGALTAGLRNGDALVAGKLPIAGAKHLDNSGNQRYLTGIEIGLLIAAAGIAKARLNNNQTAQALKADKVLSTRSGKEISISPRLLQEKSNGQVFLSDLAKSARRFPGKEITLSAVIALSSTGKQIDSLPKSQSKTQEQRNLRVEKPLEKAPKNEIVFESLHLFVKKEEEDSAAKRLDHTQGIGPFPPMPGLFRARRKDEKAESDEQETDSSKDTNSKQNAAAPSGRRIHKIKSGESLLSIAESKLHDGQLAWLIADLNKDKTTEHTVEGRRVVEIKAGQKLELPSPREIADFYTSLDSTCHPDNLITIVVDSKMDRSHVENNLRAILGLRRDSVE